MGEFTTKVPNDGTEHVLKTMDVVFEDKPYDKIDYQGEKVKRKRDNYCLRALPEFSPLISKIKTHLTSMISCEVCSKMPVNATGQSLFCLKCTCGTRFCSNECKQSVWREHIKTCRVKSCSVNEDKLQKKLAKED